MESKVPYEVDGTEQKTPETFINNLAYLLRRRNALPAGDMLSRYLGNDGNISLTFAKLMVHVNINFAT